MVKRVKAIVMGMIMSAGTLGLLPATGCTTALDQAGLNGSSSFDASQSDSAEIVLKTVAII
ncbi:MAG: hypothetical protein HJJLKODD_02224 [Phycisphaerae bacterium]|nr:hypothetical protein [Phycisphaerae bacterium]